MPSQAAQSQELSLDTLVTGAIQGDRAAFGVVVGRLQKTLYYSVLRIVQNPQDARDVVQQAFLQAWAKIGTLDQASRFKSWLFSIALNRARNLVRDQGRRHYEGVEENTLMVEARASTEMVAREEKRALREALALLPTRQREVVVMRMDAEMPFTEIGEALGCTASNARVNYHHGVKRLRALLTSSREGGE